MNRKITDRTKLNFVFFEIYEIAVSLNCTFSFDQLYNFVVGEGQDGSEFRLSGKYGVGFKLRHKPEWAGGTLSFDQYREDETAESVEEIARINNVLKDFLREAYDKEANG